MTMRKLLLIGLLNVRVKITYYCVYYILSMYCQTGYTSEPNFTGETLFCRFMFDVIRQQLYINVKQYIITHYFSVNNIMLISACRRLCNNNSMYVAIFLQVCILCMTHEWMTRSHDLFAHMINS